MVMSSILDTIKQMIIGNTSDTNFDAELIVYINSAISILKKLGVGPVEFVVTGSGETWDELLIDRTDLDEVKTNIYLRVRLMFDPPQNSFLVDAIKEQIQEGTFYIEMYGRS